jgi:predicted O-methyltransferase YrrM
MAKITQQWVAAALKLADQGQSKLTERERELFGLSSERLRCLINNVCAVKNTSYLEIGLYRGATALAAAYGNETTRVVGVDHFKYDEREAKRWAPEGYIWDNMKSQMEANLNRYVTGDNGVNLDNIEVIESSFENVEWNKQKKFDVVFFDAVPVNTSLYDDFFNKTLQAVNSEAVLMFSQYSNPEHARELEAAILRHADKLDITWQEKRTNSGTSNARHYYSGVAIYGIKKKAAKVAPKPAPKKPEVKSPTKDA